MSLDRSAFAVAEPVPLPRSSRPAWRQRLVDAERGVMQGIRGDSAFFVYFFLSSPRRLPRASSWAFPSSSGRS